jgi:hypothetical protein
VLFFHAFLLKTSVMEGRRYPTINGFF